MGNRRSHVVPGAESALDRFKWETAKELGLAEQISEEGWGNVTTRNAGRVGGQMVRQLIKEAESSLTDAERRDPENTVTEGDIT